MTKIRTWVIAATMQRINHHTITAIQKYMGKISSRRGYSPLYYRDPT